MVSIVRLRAGRGSRAQIKDYTLILARQKTRVQTGRFAARRLRSAAADWAEPAGHGSVLMTDAESEPQQVERRSVEVAHSLAEVERSVAVLVDNGTVRARLD